MAKIVRVEWLTYRRSDTKDWLSIGELGKAWGVAATPSKDCRVSRNTPSPTDRRYPCAEQTPRAGTGRSGDYLSANA